MANLKKALTALPRVPGSPFAPALPLMPWEVQRVIWTHCVTVVILFYRPLNLLEQINVPQTLPHIIKSHRVSCDACETEFAPLTVTALNCATTKHRHHYSSINPMSGQIKLTSVRAYYCTQMKESMVNHTLNPGIPVLPSMPLLPGRPWKKQNAVCWSIDNSVRLWSHGK